MLLGLLGGGLGIALGVLGSASCFARSARATIPRLEEIQINVRVLLFASCISIGASILFGLAPAFRISRMSLADALKEGSTRATSGAERGLARQALVVAEIALSLVLLTGAGLAVRSFMKGLHFD